MKSGFWRLGLALLLALGAFLFYEYRQPRFVAGEQAPDFSVTLAGGEAFRLSDLQGKYVLLQFWGSWCGPCRAENPHLADLYEQYKDAGFEIVSVAIEQNPRNWQRAIEADGMVWKYHTAEFSQFKGPLAKLFNIHSIPTTFLLNPEGVIMGVNLSPERMDKMLRQ